MTNNPEFRTCIRCKQEYSIHDFPHNGGYRKRVCRHCQREYYQEWYKKNGNSLQERRRTHYQKDPWIQRRKALQSRDGAEIAVSIDDLKHLWALSGEICHYCKNPLVFPQFTFDHAQPLAKGGLTTLDNLRICCLHCNSQKRDLTELEYFILIDVCPF
jgi:5-methylcytosine-specific restriction endonuclease McrA